MTTLPDSLSRKSVKMHFHKLTEAQWDWLFAHEKSNGLHALRVEGPYQQKAYYRTEGLIHWLVRESHYRADEFGQKAAAPKGPWSGLASRTHALAG